jgi:hypothetical protein
MTPQYREARSSNTALMPLLLLLQPRYEFVMISRLAPLLCCCLR